MFGIPKELNPEERFAQMEKNYAAFIQRIQAYDKVLDDFDKITKTQTDLSNENESIKKSVQGANDLTIAFSSQSYKSYQDLESAVKELSAKASFQQGLIDLLGKDLDRRGSSLIQVIQEQSSKVAEDLKAYAKNESLISVKNGMMEAVNSIKPKIEYLFSSMESSANTAFVLQSSIDKLSEAGQALLSQLISVQNELTGLKKDCNFDFALLRSQIQKSIDSVKDQVVTYMDNTKIEMIGSPSSMDSVKKSIASQMESIALDGSNAVLKSANNEQMIKLLEKKVENLSILMKKNEFNKM